MSLRDQLGHFTASRSADARFWEKVELGPTCWLWLASVDAYGYGQFHLNGTTVKAHRLAWFWLVGPTSWELDHIVCDTARCVNPAHMVRTTRGENTARANSRRNRLTSPSSYPILVTERGTHSPSRTGQEAFNVP